MNLLSALLLVPRRALRTVFDGEEDSCESDLIDLPLCVPDYLRTSSVPDSLWGILSSSTPVRSCPDPENSPDSAPPPRRPAWFRTVLAQYNNTLLFRDQLDDTGSPARSRTPAPRDLAGCRPEQRRISHHGHPRDHCNACDHLGRLRLFRRTEDDCDCHFCGQISSTDIMILETKKVAIPFLHEHNRGGRGETNCSRI